MAVSIAFGIISSGGLVATASEPSSSASPASFSIHEVRAGQFCKRSDKNKVKRATNGARVKCKLKGGRYRWVNL